MPNATKRDYEAAFTGLDFPTSKAAVVNRARDNGGIDREVYATKLLGISDTAARLLEVDELERSNLIQAERIAEEYGVAVRPGAA